jgi:hypothetical protein
MPAAVLSVHWTASQPDPMPTGFTLTREELVSLTGYRQPSRQLSWLQRHLRITSPRRADGLPVVTRLQVENALAAQATGTAVQTSGPRWSKTAP